jgi:hypothetical protein
MYEYEVYMIEYRYTEDRRGGNLGCSIGTVTGTGDPVPGSPDPVVNNARWRPLGSKGENKTRKRYYSYRYRFTSIYTYAAPESGH